ncbi:BA75_00170T0 [Komagataella pastoris]|uniref:BA75_00170T0 n=1 Tax=Komagataella pastoris TaxID=4922 RepID=A0A1B2J9J7_PICPA|nr:BA75_00170T0 [Komagataella pastoris]
MADDNYYSTPHEAALALVATAMKKARLRPEMLVISSIIAGMLFTVGGMLHLLTQAHLQGFLSDYMGIINLIQGSVYPIGLFYVVILGTELFNSNVLFFTVALIRGSVSIVDLLVNWVVSFVFNFASTLFVCEVICHLSGITSTDSMRIGSIQIIEEKARCGFVKTLLRGIPGNFFVCLAIYLQLMVKPLHVKFLMIFLPIFTFVTMGFTHVVADFYLCLTGIINGSSVSVGEYIWKIMIPATIGNIIGGVFFAIAIPWYLHLYVVEQDRQRLDLPEYVEKDEQPYLSMDSRVVRVPETRDSIVSTGLTRFKTTNSVRSTPKGVFPVVDMDCDEDADIDQVLDADQFKPSYNLKKMMTKRKNSTSDVESKASSYKLDKFASRGTISERELGLFRRLAPTRNNSHKSASSEFDTLQQKVSQAGITPAAAGASDEIAGTDSNAIKMMARSHQLNSTYNQQSRMNSSYNIDQLKEDEEPMSSNETDSTESDKRSRI